MTITRKRHALEGQTLPLAGWMKRKGRLVLTVVLADDSRKHIPAEWTDLSPASAEEEKGNASEAIAAVADLLRARAHVDHLLRRAQR